MNKKIEEVTLTVCIKTQKKKKVRRRWWERLSRTREERDRIGTCKKQQKKRRRRRGKKCQGFVREKLDRKDGGACCNALSETRSWLACVGIDTFTRESPTRLCVCTCVNHGQVGHVSRLHAYSTDTWTYTYRRTHNLQHSMAKDTRIYDE